MYTHEHKHTCSMQAIFFLFWRLLLNALIIHILTTLTFQICAQWTSSILLALKENKVSILHNFKEITDFQKAELTFNLTKRRPRWSNSSLQITTWQQTANPPQQGQTIEQEVTVKLRTGIPENPFLLGGHCNTMTGY